MIPPPVAGGASRMRRAFRTGTGWRGTAAAGVARHTQAAGLGPRAAGQRQVVG